MIDIERYKILNVQGRDFCAKVVFMRFSPETQQDTLSCFGLLLIIQGKTGIKSKTHFHIPYKSRWWKCAWLEQVTRVELAGNSLGILLSSIFFGCFEHFIHFLFIKHLIWLFLCKVLFKIAILKMV